MIVNVRLDVTEEQRNALARMLTPNAQKRLATRAEFVEHVQKFIDRLGQEAPSVPERAPEMEEAPAAPAAERSPQATRESDMDPLKQATMHANTAMFAIGEVRRMNGQLPSDTHQLAEQAGDAVYSLRSLLIHQFGGDA